MAGNPFLLELVIEIMLEEADVGTLKTLRELDSHWNKLDLKELEKRAVGDQLLQLDFSSGWPCPDHGQAQFLESTASIPQLFQSFQFHIPNSFKFIHPLINKYTPSFLHLEFFEETQFMDSVAKYLQNLFIWIAPTLQELKVERITPRLTQEQDILSSANGAPLVFHKLTKLIWDMGDYSSDRDEHIPFKCILDKSGAVDPTPNLTTLEACINQDFLKMMDNAPMASRWSKLTSLRILACVDDDYFKIPSTLLTLGQAGMSLKVLALAMSSPLAESCPDFWKNWSHFLVIQARSLQVLELKWFCGFDTYDTEEVVLPKIHLPIFENLHTLHFYLSCKVSTPSGPIETRMFEMGQFPEHFPKVVHMRVNEQGLLNLCEEPVPLKSLDIIGEPNNWPIWASRIRSVESLRCNASLFGFGKAEVPWKESLKELEIEDVHFPLNVSYLTGLGKLAVREWAFTIKIENYPYLTYFQQVPSLKLSEITFNTYEEPSDETKDQFNRYFPFPVKSQPIEIEQQFPFYHYAL